MNDDLILRARLQQSGYSDDDLVKIFGLSPGAGSASDKLTDYLPGGEKRVNRRMGQGDDFVSNQQAIDRAAKQEDTLARYIDKRSRKGKETLAQTPQAMTDNTVRVPFEGPGGGMANMSPLTAMQSGRTVGGPVDTSQNGDPNTPDKVEQTTTTETMPDGSQNTTNVTDVTMNANAGTADQGATQQQQTQTQPVQQPVQQQQPIDPTARAMAQQGQAAQDINTIQQGKGADKQSWMKNRSTGGKIADFLTFGATSRFGKTGGAARQKANQQSEQQTQNYNAALARQNRMAKSMEFYHDLIESRMAIQERNTTYNLRR
jgi:hypothetical protein